MAFKVHYINCSMRGQLEKYGSSSWGQHRSPLRLFVREKCDCFKRLKFKRRQPRKHSRTANDVAREETTGGFRSKYAPFRHCSRPRLRVRFIQFRVSRVPRSYRRRRRSRGLRFAFLIGFVTPWPDRVKTNAAL